MSFYTGTGARPGVAIAAAARLRVDFGVASLAPERLRRIALRLRAYGVDSPEPEQIILVADSLPPGFRSTVAGLEVVGLAVGSDTPLVPAPDRPAVTGLGDDFFESVAEDEIVIVDGSRGRIYVSPDAGTVARYQSPTRRTRRIFLEGAHLPARTASEGRHVAVLAPAASEDDVKRAMEAGADGAFFTAGTAFPFTAADQAAMLGRMMETLGGLPLLLRVLPERLALTALARASAAGPLHLLVDDGATQAETGARLAEVETVLDAKDIPYGTPQFELAVSAADPDAPVPDALDGFTGLFAAEALGDAPMERLLLLAGLARRAHKPLLLALGDDWPTELPAALSLGATRLLVPAQAVPGVKDAIRAW